MSDSTKVPQPKNQNLSKTKAYFSPFFVLFLISVIFSTFGCGEPPRIAGKFYGYSSPSTTTFGSSTVQVGPVLYEVQFDYSEKESANVIKVKMQELETKSEKGGDWQPAFEGTRFTNNGYIDEYAKPIYLYGTYKINTGKKSIKISGTISTGAYTDPFLFEWVIDKGMIVEDKNTYIIKKYDDLCFEFPISASNKINVCSTPKYFITKMIEEIEHTHNMKVSEARRKDLLSEVYR